MFALANVSTLTGPDSSHLLIISQESGKVVNVDRSGHVSSTLTIESDPDNPLSVPDQTHEGVTMDDDGTIYTVSEDGGGDFNHPQLWVYKPTNAPDQAPTGVLLHNVVSSIAENTSTQGGLKVADITVLDDGLGTNDLSVSGPDARYFEVDGTGLFIKSGTVLDFETKPSYTISVNVDDPTVGSSPDASTPYTLTLTDVVNENAPPGTVAITEVAPWSSGNSPVGQDWWEVTNLGGTAVDLAGWRMDDNSYAFGSSVALRGTWNGTSSNGPGILAPGQSKIFIESGATGSAADAALLQAFTTTWWGPNGPPAGVSIGFYGGSGVGLGTGGDAVNLFSGSGARITGVSFGVSTTASPLLTFDNSAAIGGIGTDAAHPAPEISMLSAVGVDGAFTAAGDHASVEVGSPGVDFLPPTFTNVPFDLTAEATGTTTPVPFAAPTATDLIDGVRPVVCTPASPGPFALGTTTVSCSASDAAGNTATATFHVTVRDTKPPVVNVPADVTVEATGVLTPVPFGPVTATDAVDGVTTATCSPASPGPFPIGTTHVDCFTIDSHGNRGSAPFNITVKDTTAPAVTVPGNVTRDATSPAGAVVSFTAGATDAVGVTGFACVPPSGSTFPIGTTTVTCAAADAAGNIGHGSFTVHVKGASEQLADLLLAVTGVGPGKSLEAKVTEIQGKVAARTGAAACGSLGAFVNEVNAQTGKKIGAAQAASLVGQARNIMATLGC